MSEMLEVKVPDIGDFDAVDVVEVLVAAGDAVAEEESLITLESDKATMDVPAPASGVVHEVKVKAGDKVHEGSTILILETGESRETRDTSAESAQEAEDEAPPGRDAADAEPSEAAPASEKAAVSTEAPEQDGRSAPEPAVSPAGAGESESEAEADRHPVEVVQADFSKVYASPAVRRFARELGVDLTQVRGTGRKGRILTEDVRTWVKEVVSAPTGVGGAGAAVPPMPAIDFSKFGDVEKVALTRVQKISGPNLQRSWLNVPHVTQHDEADITELEAFRQQHKAEAKARGFNLTPLAFIIKATVRALEEFPRVNSSLDLDGEHLVLKRYYHFGIAVDTDEGLLVPVIRDVDRKGIVELAEELAEVSSQARERKLTPDRFRGASFTISSLGGIGGSFFTPIINTPEVAILGVGRHRWAPHWNGSEFEPRLMLPLSLSYDHRVIDGALAVRFTSFLSQVLADIRRLLL